MSETGPIEAKVREHLQASPHGATVACMVLAKHVDKLYGLIGIAGDNCPPPKGSRLSTELARTSPAMRAAVKTFEECFDRRPTVAEVAGLGFGVNAPSAGSEDDK